ncbi:bifunctional hydroxymethylpyrimidine kinase/phosphomethylpyrimidine kinase [Methanocorpusculum petauri]|nr:bifunctional hydroxymethylpyrimidine kinase/phosphomethylpyrimidine kinase [Methanocorpusculum petauri]MDE2443985.1 bifunctional hydroxymethylpyrimidine kinase/phosphomethylpyrimidine kinase [Methanocorpusculum sp.]
MVMTDAERGTAFAVSIAGSDPSAGAGLQIDLKTMNACGVWGMTVVAALTAQNANHVRAIAEVDPVFVQSQIKTLQEDFPIACYKTGMLGNAPTVRAVAGALPDGVALVIDPVLIATREYRLTDDSGAKALVEELIPRATVVTPNIPEAETLSGIAITDAASMEDAASWFFDCGASAVVLKGGHAAFRKGVDVFLDRNGVRLLSGNVYPFPDVHGSGCCFASAIASYIALGYPVAEAVERGKEFVDGALRYAVEYAPRRFTMNPGWRDHTTYTKISSRR